MKKLLSLLLAIMMMMGCISVTAETAEFPALDRSAGWDYLGDWFDVSGMDVMGDPTTDYPSLKLCLYIDGLGDITIGEEKKQIIGWYVEDEIVYLAYAVDRVPDPEQIFAIASFEESGRLVVDLGYVSVRCEQEGEEYIDVEWPEFDAEDAKYFIGAWKAITYISGEMEVSAEQAGDMIIVLNDDGTALSIEDGEEPYELRWYSDYSVAYVGENMMELAEISFDGNGNISVKLDEETTVIMEPTEYEEAAPVVETGTILGTWEDSSKTIEITEDGELKMIYKSDGYTNHMKWGMVDDMPTVTLGTWKDATIVFTDGKLVVEPNGLHYEFTRVGEVPDIYVGPGGFVVSEDDTSAAFVGDWNEDDGRGVLTFNADFTAVMNFTDGRVYDFNWKTTDTGAIFTSGMWFDTAMVIENENTLNIGEGWMILHRDGADAAASTDSADSTDSTDTAASADVEPFMGEWTDGYGQNLLFTEDGKCMVDGEIEWNWEMADGVFQMTWGNYMGEVVTVDADGALHIGDLRTYYRPDAEIPSNEPAAVAGEAGDFVGIWHATTMEVEGMTFSIADMGMVMELTISEDGTLTMFDGESTESAPWTLTDGMLEVVDVMQLSLTEDGRMCMADESGLLYFERGEASSVGGETPIEGSETTDDAPDGSVYLGKWDKEDNGNSLIIRDDGTLDLVYPDGDFYTMEWVLTDGLLEVTVGSWSGYSMTVDEDDALHIGAFVYYRAPEESDVPETTGDSEAVAIAGEMEDFAGMWIGDSTEIEGMTMALSDLGLTMEITLGADGSITLYDGEATETGVWTLVDGKADIDGMICTLMSDGTMVAEDPDGMKVVFKGFVGEWKACYLSTGGLTGDPRTMGIASTLILNADGTGSIDFPTPEEGSWYTEEGVVRFGANGMPMEILSGGFLKFGSDLAGYLVFSQDENAIWDPSMNETAPAEPVTEAPTEPVTEAPAEPATEAPAAPEAPQSGDIDMNARLNRKYIAKTYTMSGTTMDAAPLGEYSVIFYENGKCDFTVAGFTSSDHGWGLQKVAVGLSEVDAFVINYYNAGTLFNAVLTEEGFDMDYYGTMILHFVPAE